MYFNTGNCGWCGENTCSGDNTGTYYITIHDTSIPEVKILLGRLIGIP